VLVFFLLLAALVIGQVPQGGLDALLAGDDAGGDFAAIDPRRELVGDALELVLVSVEGEERGGHRVALVVVVVGCSRVRCCFSSTGRSLLGVQPAASKLRRNFSTVSGIGVTSAATMTGRPRSTIHSITSAVSLVRELQTSSTSPSRPTMATAVVVPGRCRRRRDRGA